MFGPESDSDPGHFRWGTIVLNVLRRNKDRPKAPPEFFAQIAAIPVDLTAKGYGKIAGVEVAPKAIVVSGFALLIVTYLLLPKLAPVIVFSCIARFLLLAREEDQESRMAGGMGILIILFVCVLYGKGLLTA